MFELVSPYLTLYNPSMLCIALIVMSPPLHFGLYSDSSIESLMARKSTPGAKKKTAAKALAQELAVARKSPSARRAASGRHATLDEDDDPPATDTQASALASAPSLVSTSAPTSARRTRTRTDVQPLAPASDNGMFTCYCHSQLTALTGDAAPAATAAEAPRDQSPAGAGTFTDPKFPPDFASFRGDGSTLFSS